MKEEEIKYQIVERLATLGILQSVLRNVPNREILDTEDKLEEIINSMPLPFQYDIDKTILQNYKAFDKYPTICYMAVSDNQINELYNELPIDKYFYIIEG